MMSSLSLLTVAYVLAVATAANSVPIAVSKTLQNILANTHGSDQYHYPTDLTRGIVPKPIHSHNDYWRDIPFYSALSHGAVSVEADVWLVNDTLYVGHELSALTTARTFQALYVGPILDTIRRQNPSTPFVSGSSTKNGMYDTDSSQTLYLFVDLKTNADSTWPAVLNELRPLRDAGCLTSTDGKTMYKSQVTVIATGKAPLGYFVPNDPASPSSPRYIFLDAQLSTLNGTAGNGITPQISPIASTDFAAQVGNVVNETLNARQIEIIKGQIATAKGKGIGARYWNTPGWPIGTRNAVWRFLVDAGVALLNVDDLDGAAGFWQNTG